MMFEVGSFWKNEEGSVYEVTGFERRRGKWHVIAKDKDGETTDFLFNGFLISFLELISKPVVVVVPDFIMKRL